MNVRHIVNSRPKSAGSPITVAGLARLPVGSTVQFVLPGSPPDRPEIHQSAPFGDGDPFVISKSRVAHTRDRLGMRLASIDTRGREMSIRGVSLSVFIQKERPAYAVLEPSNQPASAMGMENTSRVHGTGMRVLRPSNLTDYGRDVLGQFNDRDGAAAETILLVDHHQTEIPDELADIIEAPR